ncbi:MAG: hypothetical protein CM15mP59_3960 [Flavobacteriaceae bacterium]|nr:MAG: hypothetical protein CM15mP59_3960 [Flavobacteriaceae bacterium]
MIPGNWPDKGLNQFLYLRFECKGFFEKQYFNSEEAPYTLVVKGNQL